jgi:hypothetical protein
MLVVAVAFAIIGCVSVRNALGDRDLVCSETPDDSCIRIADVGLTLLDVDKAERDYGPIPIIKVYPTGCTMDELGVPAPGAVRCWWVEASVESGRGASVAVYERADGSLQLYGRP